VEGSSKFVKLSDGKEIGSKALVIATVVSYRKLEVPGLERLQGAASTTARL
jgi:thioredoxin reductase (NADPH)